jgi:protoporphyrinogen oxidase
MIIVLGAGLAGLAAAHSFTRAGRQTVVVEKGATVGGLSRTILHNGYRFDLGGHRFLTHDESIEALIRDLLGADLLRVPRKSQIYLRGRYVDYPLRPVNAVAGLGASTALKILSDLGWEKIRGGRSRRPPVSLADWVIARFGLTLFELYFREYTEKVWGLPCERVSMEWIARRIDGLSLVKALTHALCKLSGRDLHTLTDRFLYPRLGIGQIADRLCERIAEGNPVWTGTEVAKVYHGETRIDAVLLQTRAGARELAADHFVSSLPVTTLIERLRPRAPEHVRAAAARLAYRSLITVTVMVGRERITDVSWMYLPGKRIPFGRIHEPTNWSADMAPAGRTHLVAEYFCTRGDRVWGASDEELVDGTVGELSRLGFFERREVTDAHVLRVPHAYPVFEVGYAEHLNVITDYLNRFENLQLVGRTGAFGYLNMDHALASGIQGAEHILRRTGTPVLRPVPSSTRAVTLPEGRHA